ncbi:hypothetical protein QAD02_024270 [Eretmocerus hayati]|uniref:Uncharacterized protein n=1 Tax=Eretmocerus hayati TaxID=131215 RepID=A0ACC2PYI9_9HYME|nr:hypothetical protein QAD02_024270 [Eretmocerus hayati]
MENIETRDDLKPFYEDKDHSINHVYQSVVPTLCKDEPCMLGVDEAGRGPVLGPMVYGIAYVPISQKQILVDMGCADSKALTEEKRDKIFDLICGNSDKMGWATDSISPNFIANCMYRRCKTSLNEVSMNSAIALIRKTIDSGVFLTEVYVDTVGPAEKYQTRLETLFPGIKITVSKKADAIYPIVSAASICAKVSRDYALKSWQFCEAKNDKEHGSGYPNDPVTKEWLSESIDSVFGFPLIVRFSWSTAERILESKAAKVEWDEEEDDPTGGMKIFQYFAATPAKTGEIKEKNHSFFSDRNLSNVQAL